MADIALTDLTNETDDAVGTGVFDVLMEAVGRQINKQYELNRLTGADLAAVYVGSLQAIVTESIKFLLSEQQASAAADEQLAATARNDKIADSEIAKNYASVQLLDQQRAKEGFLTASAEFQSTTALPNEDTRKQNESIEKVLLLQAQTVGFTTDAKNKLLKQMLDSAAVNATTTGVAFAADINSPNSINGVANDILDDLSSPVNIIP